MNKYAMKLILCAGIGMLLCGCEGDDDGGSSDAGSRTWSGNKTNLAGDPIVISVTVAEGGAVSITGTHWQLSAIPSWNGNDTVFSSNGFGDIHLRIEDDRNLYVNIHGPELSNSFEGYIYR